MKNLIKSTLFTASLVLVACEDDPLLAPTQPTEDKGSYAKLSLPGNGERSDYQGNPEVY